MNTEAEPDPFDGTPHPPAAAASVQNAYQPSTAAAYTQAPAYQLPQTAYPYTSYPAYGSYGGAYSGAYGGAAGYYGAAVAAPGAYGGALGARRGVAAVAGGVQDAMARFARVSAAVDDALRSLHMLFDALFGLGVAAGALFGELRVLLRAKSGPAAFVGRMLRRVLRIWRMLMVAVASPLHSPFGVVLGALGVAPPTPPTGEEDTMQRVVEQHAFESAFDGSNL